MTTGTSRAAAPPLTFLRKRGVLTRTGFSSSQLDRLEALNLFPKRVPLGQRAVGWIEYEIVAWQRARIARRDAIAVAEERRIARIPPAQRHRLREAQQREEAAIRAELQRAELSERERSGTDNIWSDAPA
jgi:prophage regulatory protein